MTYSTPYYYLSLNQRCFLLAYKSKKWEFGLTRKESTCQCALRRWGLTVGTDDGGDCDEVLAGNEAEVKDKKGSSDHPVNIASIEELSATSNCGPALAGKHGKVGEGSHTADESIAEIVLPALSIRGSGLGHHHYRRHCESKETQGEGAHTGGAHLLDGCACRGCECLQITVRVQMTSVIACTEYICVTYQQTNGWMNMCAHVCLHK